MNDKILLVNSSGRFNASFTRNLSNFIVERLQDISPNCEVISRELADGLPFVNEHWIEANFTRAELRNERQCDELKFSDELVTEIQLADNIVIASPIYNFSIPAVLKAWIDLIARAGLTFKYTENGPEGLILNKNIYIAMASGGVPISSEMDFASPYLKHVLGFVGLTDVTVIDASKINLSNESDKLLPNQQIAELIK